MRDALINTNKPQGCLHESEHPEAIGTAAAAITRVKIFRFQAIRGIKRRAV